MFNVFKNLKILLRIIREKKKEFLKMSSNILQYIYKYKG